MFIVLLQAFSLVLIIFIAFFSKKIGLFKRSDGHVISNLIIYITLPATIIVVLDKVPLSTLFFELILAGFLANLALIVIGGFIWHKKSSKEQSLMMFSITGYNIGNFTLPFIQGFFPAAIHFLFMFDIGNSLMLSGFSPIIVNELSGNNHSGFDFRLFFKKIFTSIPFDTYLLIILMKILQLSFPGDILHIFSILAQANTFLSMFMIGLYMELNISLKKLIVVGKVLCTRYFFAILLALFFFFALPLPLVVRKTLVLLAFAPFASLATIGAVKHGNDEKIVGFISSASIIISIILMTLLILWMGI